MDRCAEMTLRLVRTGQEALDPRSSLIGWTLFPSIKQMSWSEARDILASAPKPVLVAALIEPGAIALWSMAELEHQGRAALEYQIRNQSEYYDAKLRAIGLATADAIETPDGEFRLSMSDFKQWTHDYCMTVIGVGMGISPSPGVGRLLVRRPGGHQPPIGWIDPVS
jgi:hypothetical protein